MRFGIRDNLFDEKFDLIASASLAALLGIYIK